MPTAPASGLRVVLESPLPPSLAPGRATAVWCAGVCWHPDRTVVALEIEVAGARRPVDAFNMPRPDVRDAAGERGYLSGWWATLTVAAPVAGDVELTAVARLDDGAEAAVGLGALPVPAVEPPPPAPVPAEAGAGLIAVCMATFEPDDALLRVQLESLRAQTDHRWVCVISDDASSPEHLARIEAAVDGDPRFLVSPAPRRLGFYRNFERALRLAPPEAELIALADQDDRWHPDKLATLRAALGSAGLVYSDQRLTAPDGRVLRETMWRGRRNNHTSIASALIANTITGAASLMRRDVAELALPFPETPGLQFHDHWIAVAALAAGDVAYVDRPLYDYVQHGGAVLGRAGQAKPEPRLRRPRGPRGEFDRWRKRFFFGYLPREIQARTALARCADRLTAPKRRALERFAAGQRSWATLAWLALRAPLRELARRNETLGTEVELAEGLLWRRLVARRAARAGAAKPFDARFPAIISYDDMGFEQRRLRRWRATV